MDGGGGDESDFDRDEDEAQTEILRDRFRLSAISVAQDQAKRVDMEVSEPVLACIADLAFKYTDFSLRKQPKCCPCMKLLCSKWVKKMSSISLSSRVIGSSSLSLKPASQKLFVVKDVNGWSKKAVSNGSRIRCMKVWNPIDNKKFETLSYLPPLTDESIAKETGILVHPYFSLYL